MHYTLIHNEGLLKITYMTLSDAIHDCAFEALTPNSSLPAGDIQGKYLTYGLWYFCSEWKDLHWANHIPDGRFPPQGKTKMEDRKVNQT